MTGEKPTIVENVTKATKALFENFVEGVEEAKAVAAAAQARAIFPELEALAMRSALGGARAVGGEPIHTLSPRTRSGVRIRSLPIAT
jgi:hypothetical protein